MTLLSTMIPARLSRFLFAVMPNGIAWITLFTIGCALSVEALSGQASAEIRTITAQGEYRLGDHDTKEDGIRLATEQAKRNALDQVASYLESVTTVRDLDVTQDEIRSYTAGVVLVLDQRIHLRLDDQTVVVHVALTAQVDTEEVVQALAAVKQHEAAREELLALKRELDQVHRDLDAVNQTLAAATTPEQRQKSTQQRDELLQRAQSSAMVAQAWTNWMALVSPLTYPSAWNGGMSSIQALIAAAGQLNPNNPHLNAVRQAVAAQTPTPRQPPAPPVPHTVPFLPRMPTYQVVPRSSAAPHEGKQPAENQPADRRLKSMYLVPPTLYTWPRTGEQNGSQAPRQGTTANPYGTALTESSRSSPAQNAPQRPGAGPQPFHSSPQQSSPSSPGALGGGR